MSDGTVRITKYTGRETVMTVPATINGKTVTELGPRLTGYDDQIAEAARTWLAPEHRAVLVYEAEDAR